VRLGLLTLAFCSGCAAVGVSYIGEDGGIDAPSRRDAPPPPDSGTPDAVTDAPAFDAAVAVLSGQLLGDGGFCGCEQNAGVGCCVPPDGAPFCSSTYEACTHTGAAFLGCIRGDLDSICCWHGLGRGSSTAMAAACTEGPVACATDADCAPAGACMQATCGGITVGACNQVPTCPSN
jgi:hypothetical protein